MIQQLEWENVVFARGEAQEVFSLQLAQLHRNAQVTWGSNFRCQSLQLFIT